MYRIHVGCRKLKMSPVQLKKPNTIQIAWHGKREHNRAKKNKRGKENRSVSTWKVWILRYSADNQAKRFFLTKKAEMFSSRNVYYLMDINVLVL